MAVKVDKVDKELMALLYDDGRTTLTSLGEHIAPVLNNDKDKISHVAVQKRLQKLVENEIIKIQANVNISTLNYISAFILIETREYDAQKRIIERFRLCPRVVSIDLVSGKYNIIMRAQCTSLKEMESFLSYCWLKQEEGIRNLEIFISTTNVRPKYMPMPIISAVGKKQIAPCGFRCQMCDLYKHKECCGCPATHFSESKQEEEKEIENH